MTRRDQLASQHEPFGDAFYFGPECVSPRFKDDVERREASGVSDVTYGNTFEKFDKVEQEVRTYPARFPSCAAIYFIY